MKEYNYAQIDEHIQWLIKMMDREYPNDYELVIDSIGAIIRSTQRTLVFPSNNGKIGLNNSPIKEVQN